MPPRGKPGRPRNPNGRKVTDQGHVLIRLEDDTWVPEHRKLLEDHLGRKLRSTEKVKHIDLNKSNNVLTNLEIWEEVKTWPV